MSRKTLVNGFIFSCLVWISIFALVGCRKATPAEIAANEKYWAEYNRQQTVRHCYNRLYKYDHSPRELYDCFKMFEREDVAKQNEAH